jgi:uncharacterized membrane protein YdjX (TVP38/TMEM64 family)
MAEVSSTPTPAPEAAATASTSALLKLALLVTLFVGGALAVALTPLGSYLSREGVGQAIGWLRGSTSAPLLYIGIYAIATALAIPGSVLTLAGGAMFGVLWGTVYTTIAANIGANLAFGVGRFLGREGVERLAGARLQALDRATASHGFRGLLTLRLIPAVPFNALNFGSGLTAIRWPTYAMATAIGIFPGTLVYTMFADALLAGSQEASREAFARVLLSGALLVLLSFLPAIARRIGMRLPGTAVMVVSLAALGGEGSTAGLGPAEARAQEVPTHAAFSAVLRDVVHQPLVDYQAVVDAQPALRAYLGTLAATSLEAVTAASREEQLAFWINAYNACMLQLVADHYPIEKDGNVFARIKNSVAGRPANSVWQIPDVFTRSHCRVAGKERSQDELEHEIIRPMGEPRIHFAVNCAAQSCPVLWPEAYEAATLEAQLDRAVEHLVADERHFVAEASVVRLNKVLDWFKEDFGGEEGLRSFFAPYLSQDAARILTDPDTRLEFFDYDWTLNDVER